MGRARDAMPVIVERMENGMHAGYWAWINKQVTADSYRCQVRCANLQVHGKTPADSYVVFPEHYCSCKAFQFDVVGKGDAPFVSHHGASLGKT